MKENLGIWLQWVLPHHRLSVLMSKLTHSTNPLLKQVFIRAVIKIYNVDMTEALRQKPSEFKNFNDFFTRELKPDARPVATGRDDVASPADGKVSQAGAISNGQIFQAKGKTFSAQDLLGGCAERAAPFQNGQFVTIYLSPKNYHRLHMPLAGKLKQMVHVPGRLFRVDTAAANGVTNLFARNERVCCLFDTVAGPMALVLVGAIFVSSVETVWQGVVTPPTGSQVRVWDYADDQAPVLDIGAEMGRFNMGSTIIVLFGADAVAWNDDLVADQTVHMGGKIGATVSKSGQPGRNFFRRWF